MPTPRHRSTLFKDPANDRLTSILTALTAEVSAAVSRMDCLEMLLTEKGVLEAGELDGYKPDTEGARRLQQSREAFVSRVFYILKAEFDELG